MRFRKLRVTGFKSFVEPAELLIEAGLTGVVGPNGCGKSNLLEAIRWVMGEGSPKSLRGGGMEDVIFAGTAARPARDFAEVTLLAETRDPATGAWAEQEVIRRIERGAGSAYRLNGRDVRQRDVALLFADAATGAHSPALVSQGRIAAVIAAKPQSRREMLEEAAGIAGLHVRRKEAETRLRATEANLVRLDELLADMDTRANALRRQARAAERYRALSADIRIAEARALFARWREAAHAAALARERTAQAEQAVHEAAEAQRAAAAYAAGSIAAVADARAAAEMAREAFGEAGRALDGLRAERAAVDRRIADLAQQIATLVRDRDREDRLSIDAAAALKALDAEEKALAKAVAAAEAERGGVDGKVAEAESAVRDAEVAVAQALGRAAQEEADARVAAAAAEAARQRHARATAETQRVAHEIAALGNPVSLEAKLSDATAQRTAAEAAFVTANAVMAEAEVARDEASRSRETAESAGQIAAADLARLESEAKALGASLARDADGANGGGALTRLRVATGYERALAAALGDDLDAPIGGQGARGWAGAGIASGDAGLPEGLIALASLVTGGEPLARRLAQIGVAEVDDGTPLAVGQRLVTTAGALRRWDGYFARDVGAAAADRLVRANRHAELEVALPGMRAATAEARSARDAAAAAFVTARTGVEEARRKASYCEDQLRTTRRAEDAAAAAVDRHTAAAAALKDRDLRVRAEQEEAMSALTLTQDAIARLPDRSISRAALDRLNATADLARATLASARTRAVALADALRRDQQRREAVRAEAKGWRSRAGDAARRIEEMAQRLVTAEREQSTLAEKPAQLAQAIAEADAIVTLTGQSATSTRAAEAAAEVELRRHEAAAAQAGEVLASAREARATIAAHAQHQDERRQELSRLAGDRFQCPAATLADRIGFDPASLDHADAEGARHDRLSADRERLGPVNLVAETELVELEQSRATNAAERGELGEAVHRLRGSIGSLNREGRQRLLAAFEAVDDHFRRLFTTLFTGGEAHLALIDSDDPLEAGLEIMAQPPGKRLGSLTLLSGGEQALTAVALIFALFLTNPAPICVLDEVDAPLDDANIERFCDLLIAMTAETDTRYLVVTHNAVTMSRMHRLFGVTMIERGISRLVSVDLGGAERLLAAE